MAYFSKEQTSNIHQHTFAFIQVEEQDNILTVTLNRPEKRNAMHPPLLNELAFAYAYAHHHNHVWAVVLQANGPVFCAGADLKAFMGATEEHNSTVPQSNEEILMGEIFNKTFKPSIARVHGDVYAGAFLLLAGCTHVVAADHIKLGLPEVKRGIFPFQVMASLMEIMPPRKVLDWSMGGYNLPVEKAFEYGLVTHLATSETLDQTIAEIIKELKQNSPSAIRLGIEAYRNICDSSTAERHHYLKNMLQKALATEDAKEGITAFKEKRKPQWTGA
ncbi:enoyl-CoA hydratase-related protein [Limibacter armeniacum]|uniref:enoyl-CoA hydratase-related protein n=1 Tax=Limibacter armeniacum TaxID=466084 RepID=UPI002FE58C28